MRNRETFEAVVGIGEGAPLAAILLAAEAAAAVALVLMSLCGLVVARVGLERVRDVGLV